MVSLMMAGHLQPAPRRPARSMCSAVADGATGSLGRGGGRGKGQQSVVVVVVVGGGRQRFWQGGRGAYGISGLVSPIPKS